MIYVMFSGGGSDTVLIINYFLISYVTGSAKVPKCKSS